MKTLYRRWYCVQEQVWPPGGDSSGCIEVYASCVKAAFFLLTTKGWLLWLYSSLCFMCYSCILSTDHQGATPLAFIAHLLLFWKLSPIFIIILERHPQPHSSFRAAGDQSVEAVHHQHLCGPAEASTGPARPTGAAQGQLLPARLGSGNEKTKQNAHVCCLH